MISINVGIQMADSLYYIVSKPAILSLKLTLLSSMLLNELYTFLVDLEMNHLFLLQELVLDI